MRRLATLLLVLASVCLFPDAAEAQEGPIEGVGSGTNGASDSAPGTSTGGGTDQPPSGESDPDSGGPAPAASAEATADVVVPGGVVGEGSVPGVQLTLADGPVFSAKVGPNRAHGSDGVFVDPPCGEWRTHEILDDGTVGGIYAEPVCIEPLTCGAERIDDYFQGRISGTAAQGVYGDYVQFLIGVHGISVARTSPEDVSAGALLAGLGPSPGEEAIAVFHYCRRDSGDFQMTGTWGPRFSWDSSFDGEYDRPTVINDLFTRLRARVDLYEPTVAMAPPFDQARTWVRFPTWFWVDSPLVEAVVSSDQDLGIFELGVRAVLEHVEFGVGDQVLPCGLDEMKAYVHGETHPIDDVGPCHIVFDELADEVDISVVLTYAVQERLSTRVHRTFPWRHGPWTPHAVAELVVAHDAGTIAVREILAVNTNQ